MPISPSCLACRFKSLKHHHCSVVLSWLTSGDAINTTILDLGPDCTRLSIEAGVSEAPGVPSPRLGTNLRAAQYTA